MVVDLIAAGLERVHERVGGRFARAEPRRMRPAERAGAARPRPGGQVRAAACQAGPARLRAALAWLSPRGRLTVHAPTLVAGILVTGLIAAGCGPAQSSRIQPVNRALVTPDGLRIIAAAMEGGCDRAHLTAGERPAQVMLRLSIVTTVPQGTACALAAMRVTVSATLRRPLWGRRLTDAATGRPVRYFDGRQLLRVAYLPAGYRFSVDTPTAMASAMPPSAPVPWTRVYQGPHGATRLYVTQVPQPGQPAAVLPVTQQTEVGGHPAALRGQPEADTATVCCRAVTWSAGGYAFAVLSEPVPAGGALPYSVLEMIASSLRP